MDPIPVLNPSYGDSVRSQERPAPHSAIQCGPCRPLSGRAGGSTWAEARGRERARTWGSGARRRGGNRVYSQLGLRSWRYWPGVAPALGFSGPADDTCRVPAARRVVVAAGCGGFGAGTDGSSAGCRVFGRGRSPVQAQNHQTSLVLLLYFLLSLRDLGHKIDGREPIRSHCVYSPETTSPKLPRLPYGARNGSAVGVLFVTPIRMETSEHPLGANCIGASRGSSGLQNFSSEIAMNRLAKYNGTAFGQAKQCIRGTWWGKMRKHGSTPTKAWLHHSISGAAPCITAHDFLVDTPVTEEEGQNIAVLRVLGVLVFFDEVDGQGLWTYDTGLECGGASAYVANGLKESSVLGTTEELK
ncbi:hypothetical protein C8J57DRAFT_1254088 [Mycena rebaudengoi]|nr:hypothetical protein C8J57DRAFT_1254088 [Mycena rebaudengoi]